MAWSICRIVILAITSKAGVEWTMPYTEFPQVGEQTHESILRAYMHVGSVAKLPLIQ